MTDLRVASAGLSSDERTTLGYLLHPYFVEIAGEDEEPDLIVCRENSSHFARYSKPLVVLPPISASPNALGEHENHGSGIVMLPFDVIMESWAKFDGVMNPKISTRYTLSTKVPFSYRLAPPWIRNRFLRAQIGDMELSRHLTVELARKRLTDAIQSLGFTLRRRSHPALVITHDIETQRGLEKALLLKSVENELEIESTWFLPSDEYPIARNIAAELGWKSIIGSHDVKHDGRLMQMHDSNELAQRLSKSKRTLEQIFDQDVNCFRSPLLQFSRKILSGLRQAGYTFDFSLPCWEPAHPSAMGGFGIELAQPFEADGVVEIPLTLFQDHQVLSVLGMNTHEATKLWTKQAKMIRSFGGDIVLLVHPDYSFSRDLEEYKDLLVSLLQVHLGSENPPRLM
jgi:hypothetical protein